MKQVSAKVIYNLNILPEYKRPHGKGYLETRLIWLACPEIAREAKPGQFVMVRCGTDCTLPRPFSIFRIYGKCDLALFYAVCEDGKGTQWLAERHVGDQVEVFGPLGNGFTISPSSKNILLVAGGMGIAPLFFLAQMANTRSCSAILLYGTANSNRYPIPPEIKHVAATEDGSTGYKGMVNDLIPQYIDWADQIFVCGPMPMFRDLAQKQIAKRKPVQVSLEVRMGCGTGVCYGCTVKTRHGLRQVCKDGPVFDLADIIWDNLTV